jgi:uncharacterized protein
MNTSRFQHGWIATTGAIGLAVALVSLPVSALTVQEVPNPQQTHGGWVTDMAGILTDETEAQLNQMITQLEADNGTEIAVVTVPETAPSASPKAFATELFNTWGIGKDESDNGVLFLVSIGDRRVEIETGYGIEPILSDAAVSEIIDYQITPQFKQNHFDAGTLAGTQALVRALATSPTSATQASQPSENQGDASDAGGLFFLVMLVIGGMILNAKQRRWPGTRHSTTNNHRHDHYHGGGGGGGGGFGGGSSGGGGSGGNF